MTINLDSTMIVYLDADTVRTIGLPAAARRIASYASAGWSILVFTGASATEPDAVADPIHDLESAASIAAAISAMGISAHAADPRQVAPVCRVQAPAPLLRSISLQALAEALDRSAVVVLSGHLGLDHHAAIVRLPEAEATARWVSTRLGVAYARIDLTADRARAHRGLIESAPAFPITTAHDLASGTVSPN